MSYWKERFSSFCSYQHSNSGISTSISSDMKRFAGAKLKQSFNVKSLQFNTPPLSVMWFNNCKLKITKTQEAKTANTLRPDVERKSTRATPNSEDPLLKLSFKCNGSEMMWLLSQLIVIDKRLKYYKYQVLILWNSTDKGFPCPSKGPFTEKGKDTNTLGCKIWTNLQINFRLSQASSAIKAGRSLRSAHIENLCALSVGNSLLETER